MAGRGKRTTRSRAGWARAGDGQPAPRRRGAGFWLLIVGAILLVIAVVAIAITALSGTAPAGAPTLAVPALLARVVAPS